MLMNSLLAIGLMSGTSADGIDAALVETEGLAPPVARAFRETPYPPGIRRAVLALMAPGPGEIDALGALHRALGDLFAEAALGVCAMAGVDPAEVAVIGSHGQTIRHRPPVFTLQIGDPHRIAALTGIPVVGDFRPADVARGGQGAPLTPLFHRCLFAQPGIATAVLNLGGIANVTALPADPDAPLAAGDSGPANSLLDLLAARVSDGAASCDRDGKWASSGGVDESALAWLLAHPYLREPFPKSTGREAFGAAYLDEFLQRFPNLPTENRFATLAEFTARSAWEACLRLLPPRPDRVVLCGGGVRNPDLMARFHRLGPDCAWMESAALGVDAGSLEAQAFAWFAVRTMRGLPSSLPEATGAREPAVLGSIHAAPGRRWPFLSP
ncbi:MAG: anhydro-N-acetylmuramic acid kinase [Magnetococcales bacterium]|nr:anhydro-N-acetylmuramic acid kinase [Magnetococcales bacterium]